VVAKIERKKERKKALRNQKTANVKNIADSRKTKIKVA
jgi:hypothetical protein